MQTTLLEFRDQEDECGQGGLVAVWDEARQPNLGWQTFCHC